MVPITVAIAIAWATFVLWFKHREGWEVGRVMRRLAELLRNGVYQDDWNWLIGGSFRVRGELSSFPVEVSIATDGKRQFASFQIRVRNPPCQFEVSRSNPLSLLGRHLGLVRHDAVGDAEVDARYTIRTGRRQELGKVFEQQRGVRQALDLLLERFPSVKLEGGHVKVSTQITDSRRLSVRWIEEDLRSMIRLARRLERIKLEVPQAGTVPRICFAVASKGDEVICPFCRDGIDPRAEDAEPVSPCEACQTLHHTSCLEEAGGCTVFGCRQGLARIPS